MILLWIRNVLFSVGPPRLNRSENRITKMLRLPQKLHGQNHQMLYLPQKRQGQNTKCCTCHELARAESRNAAPATKKGVDILDVVHYVERARSSWLHMKLWPSLWAWDAQQFAFPLTMNPTTRQMLDMLNLSYPVHASYIFVTSSITSYLLLLSNSNAVRCWICIFWFACENFGVAIIFETNVFSILGRQNCCSNSEKCPDKSLFE